MAFKVRHTRVTLFVNPFQLILKENTQFDSLRLRRSTRKEETARETVEIRREAAAARDGLMVQSVGCSRGSVLVAPTYDVQQVA